MKIQRETRRNAVVNPAAPRRRKRTARFIEIAELAGVSASTVDRVLNERGSVSAAARERVVAAARVPAPVVWTGFCSSGGELHQPFLTGFEG
jgi:transcriptional regulator with XRE-family HTH domain